ncbi:MAG: hypothetical protein WCK64_09585 [Synechococcaceae cyanobacterium ELA445]
MSSSDQRGSEHVSNLASLPILDGAAYFCIAHQQPFFDLPPWISLIDTGDFAAKTEAYNVSNYLKSFNYSPQNPKYLANEAILLIEELVLRQRTNINRVCILLHRKFVSARKLGVEAQNFTSMQLVAPSEVTLTSSLLGGDSDFLTCFPLIFKQGIAWQYAVSHLIEDFLALSKVAVECEALPKLSFLDFCTDPYLIPGGGLVGMIPVELFLHCASMVRRLLIALQTSSFEPAMADDPFQGRAISFFIERLISFHFITACRDNGLIFEDLSIEEDNVMPFFFGWVHTVKADAELDPNFQAGTI